MLYFLNIINAQKHRLYHHNSECCLRIPHTRQYPYYMAVSQTATTGWLFLYSWMGINLWMRHCKHQTHPIPYHWYWSRKLRYSFLSCHHFDNHKGPNKSIDQVSHIILSSNKQKLWSFSIFLLQTSHCHRYPNETPRRSRPCRWWPPQSAAQRSAAGPGDGSAASDAGREGTWSTKKNELDLPIIKI